MHTPAFTHLLHLVPTEAPLSELRHYPSFASTHFLQPQLLPVMRNLTVLSINGQEIHKPSPTYILNQVPDTRYMLIVGRCYSQTRSLTLELSDSQPNDISAHYVHVYDILQLTFSDTHRNYPP